MNNFAHEIRFIQQDQRENTAESLTSDDNQNTVHQFIVVEDDDINSYNEDEEEEDPNVEHTARTDEDDANDIIYEPIEDYDANENAFQEGIYNSQFFPFKNEIHKLLHEFYYRIGSDISQGLMKDILSLIDKVVDAKSKDANAVVPKADHLFNFEKRKKNNIPTIKTSEHEVVVVKKEGDANIEKTFRFSMIAPSETVRHLVANPATTDRIIALPDQTVVV
ncbi:hypothetical protein BD408DRAFT_403810 [Parasitella parasitica]|nr:hypothetical protein BD408DRAFT_403810 [Parasitella parasitica]